MPLAEIGKAFRQTRFLFALLTSNFVAVPLLVLVLLAFAPDDPLVRIGLVLLVPRFQTGFATAVGPVAGWTEQRFGGFSAGLHGQFGLGLLLGAVWSPCVGPTLGAASLLAARGEHLGQVAFTMGVFGMGAALPLLGLGLLSREVMSRWRGWMMSAGSGMKAAFGAMLLVAGVLVLSGFDKVLEAAMVRSAPSWLVCLTTRF